MNQPIDTTRHIEVPEGIELALPVAGLVSRGLAFMIDTIIRWLAIWVVAIVFSFMGRFGEGLFLIMLFLVEWFYPVLFEMLRNGQTPGKKAMGIMVVNDDGSPLSWSTSIVRNLLRFADFLPLGYAAAVVSMLFSKDFKRLGDFAAGTLVVHTRPLQTDSSSLNSKPLAPRIALTLDEQSAIIAFAERRNRMSHGRLNELASYLAPWLDQGKIKSGDSTAADQLIQVAKWLRGQGG